MNTTRMGFLAFLASVPVAIRRLRNAPADGVGMAVVCGVDSEGRVYVLDEFKVPALQRDWSGYISTPTRLPRKSIQDAVSRLENIPQ